MTTKRCFNCNEEIESDLPICPICGYGRTELPSTEPDIPEYEYVEILEEKTIPPLRESSQADTQEPLPDESPLKGICDKWRQLNSSLRIKIGCIAGGGLLVICMTIIILLTTNSKTEASENLHAIMPANISKDGTAYFLTEDEVLSLKSNASKGELTPDKKHAVILEQDNTLYVMDQNGENKQQIARNVKEIYLIKDNGIIYLANAEMPDTVEQILTELISDTRTVFTYSQVQSMFEKRYPNKTLEDAKMFYLEILHVPSYDDVQKNTEFFYRYKFGEKQPVKMGYQFPRFAPDTLSVAWRDYDKILALRDNSSQIETIAKVDPFKLYDLTAISNDGSKVIWPEGNAPSIIHMSENGKETILGDIGQMYQSVANTFAFFSKDNTKVLVYGNASSHILLKEDGKEPFRIDLEGTLENTAMYTSEGILGYNADLTFSDLYLCIRNKEVDSLYHIDNDGKLELVVAEISTVISIIKGNVFYLDNKNDFYRASLKGTALSPPEKIASHVNPSILISSDGKYAYYTKTEPEKTSGDLYVAHIQKNQVLSQLLADDVHSYGISSDGQNVIYLAECGSIGDTTRLAGTLYGKNLKGNTKKICSQVLSYADYSFKEKVNTDFFPIYRYSKVNNFEIIQEFGYYNGKEYVEIADDVMTLRKPGI